MTVLEADTNGDRVADLAIELTGNKTLTANDFALGSLLAPVNRTGDGGANTLVGGEVGDTLSGLGGNDTLRGLAGNDLLDGGTGADVMEGGEGDDIYVVDNAGDVVTEGPSTPSFVLPSGWTIKGAADFNKDGNLDVVASNGSANQFWFLNADGSVRSTSATLSWSGWTLVGVLDHDHDGNTDLLFQENGKARQEVDYLTGATWSKSLVPRLWDHAGCDCAERRQSGHGSGAVLDRPHAGQRG